MPDEKKLTARASGPAMGRRSFLAGSAALAGAAPLMANAKALADRPNIILITADDLGWRDLGCYGDDNLQSPNIDALAEEGVRFTNAFVAAPSCSASRAAIITGQIPHSVGVLGLTQAHPRYQMSPDVPTLPNALREAGYRTGIHGKWHVAAYKHTKPYGYDQRMSIMFIERSDKARRFITANRGRPFYLELNFMQTHRPSLPGEGHGFAQDPDFPVDPDDIEVPQYWRIPNWRPVREDVAGYYSQAMKMDKIIGEILDHLAAQGLAERTLVVFVSDNGPPYPGCKMTCYDRGIGTPLIARWPEGLPAGQVRHGLASAMDIMPTCLEAADVRCPDTVQGVSQLGAARGGAPPRSEVWSEVTYHVKYQPMRAIRTERWKYIENLSPEPTELDQCADLEWARKIARLPGQRCCVPRPPEELFDLEADPNEDNNLAEDPAFAETNAGLRERLHRWRQDTRDPFPDLT